MEPTRDRLNRLGVAKFYAVPLGSGNGRFAVYWHNPETGELDNIWPADSHEERKAKDRPSAMRYSTRSCYPAYHFAYDEPYNLQRDLRLWLGREVKLFILRGHAPSPVG